MARKTSTNTPPAVMTPEDVEREIERKVEAENGLFPDSVNDQRREEIRREVEAQYEANLQVAHARGELERQGSVAREPIPFVESFEDAIDQFGQDLVTIDDYEKLDDKEALVGKPFAVVRWWFSPSDVGDRGEFVTMKLITKQPMYDPQGNERSKFTVADGSSGIYEQLRALTDRTGKNGGLVCRSGLRVSHYEYQGMPAATYYLT